MGFTYHDEGCLFDEEGCSWRESILQSPGFCVWWCAVWILQTSNCKFLNICFKFLSCQCEKFTIFIPSSILDPGLCWMFCWAQHYGYPHYGIKFLFSLGCCNKILNKLPWSHAVHMTCCHFFGSSIWGKKQTNLRNVDCGLSEQKCVNIVKGLANHFT